MAGGVGVRWPAARRARSRALVSREISGWSGSFWLFGGGEGSGRLRMWVLMMKGDRGRGKCAQ